MTDKLNYAGDFSIEKAEIITSSGQIINISDNIVEINFYEDIFSVSITGDLVVVDTLNLVTNGPIIGQEQLQLRVTTPGFKDNDSKINFVDEVLMIHKVALRTPVSNTAQAYKLSFISKEALTNQRITVSKSFEGTYADLVVDMLTTELKSTKNIFVEKTLNSKRLVIPDIHPFDVIRQASTQSVSETNFSPTFVFYETRNGYHFRTLESLMQKPFINEYYYGKPNVSSGTSAVIDANFASKLNEGKIAKDFKRIRKYNIASNSDLLVNTKSGMLSSHLIVHDSYNKEVTTYDFNYFDTFNTAKHMGYFDGGNANPLYSESHIDEDENRVTDFPHARTHLHSTAIKNTTTGTSASHEVNGNFSFSGSKINEWYLQRQSRFMQISSGLTLNCEIAGITSMEAGDTIDIRLPIMGAKTKHKDSYDTVYKGKFLIKTLRHLFKTSDKMHTTFMIVVKDSSNQEFSAEGVPPTNEKKDGILYEIGTT
jgi:hypothetical protein